MPPPPVEGTPLVVYYGPDSESVAREWTDAEGVRAFELRAIDAEADLCAVLAEERVDCVVCRSDGADPSVVDAVRGVREFDAEVPVVVFTDGLDVGAAVDLDVTHSFQVSSFDATALEQLVPLVERRRRERRERSMLDSLLSNIPLSVYFKDRRSRHVRVSDRQPRLTGESLENDEGKRHHTPADVLGKTEFGLYAGENAARSVAADEDIMDDGESVHEIQHIDGAQLDGTFVSTFKAPWYDGDEVVGTLGITSDVTERKQYEHQLERQNERLERFASVVSHDLRNPLEVAFGRLEFARDTGADEHFDALEGALDRMTALIEDVLTLARQGETVDDPEPVTLDVAARDAWSLVETHGATLDVATDRRYLADPDRLQQLFENVFRNAVEHSSTSPASHTREDTGRAGSSEPSVADAPEDAVEHSSTSHRSSSTREDAVEHGGTDVTVEVGALFDGEGFYVQDDGPGVPQGHREKVFDSGFSTGDEGTGLGLSIVRTIAEAHGWGVRATESESGGARFEFSQVQRPR